MTESSPIRVVADIDVSKIIVGKNRRPINLAWAEAIGQSFLDQGQLQNIEVKDLEDGTFELVYGGHRLEGARSIGWTTIRADIKSKGDVENDARTRMRNIAENFYRRPNSVLQRAVDIADWRDIHEAAFGKPKRGRKRADADLEEKSANFALNFTETAQEALGLSRRSVFMALKIATISAPVRDLIEAHRVADNQSELLALADEPNDRQMRIATLLEAGEAKRVDEAIAIIDGITPEPTPEAWAGVSDRFSRLAPEQQHRFFEAHEAGIKLWLARKG